MARPETLTPKGPLPSKAKASTPRARPLHREAWSRAWGEDAARLQPACYYLGPRGVQCPDHWEEEKRLTRRPPSRENQDVREIFSSHHRFMLRINLKVYPQL